MSFELSWREGSLKDLGKLEMFLRKRVIRKVMDFVESENFHGVKRMTGYDNLYRLRVGDYRVIFEMIGNLITVVKVGHRGKVY